MAWPSKDNDYEPVDDSEDYIKTKIDRSIRYPTITVDILSKKNDNAGNVFNLLSEVTKAMMKHKVPVDEIQEFVNDAISNDYDHFLQTCMKWVNVE